MEYSLILNNPTSSLYKELEAKVTQLFNDTYNCTDCSTRGTYLGVFILSFSSGSIVTNTQAQFKGSETAGNVQTLLEQKLSGSNNEYSGLQINNIQVSRTAITPSSGTVVPGWGIALLVLVSVLLFFCIIFIIVMVILLCLRKHRGYMDVFSTRGSYNTMHDYTSYQTHGRYVAPNKYETAGNGTKNKYSYTNQGLETNNL
ncbi:mucin-1 [Pyxicephalus adspersus]|uniref:mucin-1 n=1 Tax=Pyxicephalus adspersus TaxID=30357 RepID=UPI003B5935CC